jgi:hypothetical protein
MAILSQLSCPSSPVLPAMFWPSCPLGFVQAGLSKFNHQVNLSRLTFPCCSLLMSCHNCPATDVLSWLSCPSCPVLATLFWLSCLFCHGGLVLVVLPQLFFPVFSSCPALSFLPRLYCRSCPVQTFPFQLACPLPATCLTFAHQLSCPHCHVLTILSICPVLAVLSWISCPSCRVIAIMFWLSCLLCLSSLTNSA